MAESLTASQARRIALGAQGFAGRSRTAPPSARTLASTVERLRVLQIDSVNVWERSHYMPLFSRLGAYDKARLDALAGIVPSGTASPKASTDTTPDRHDAPNAPHLQRMADALTHIDPPRLTEYWAHEATFLAVDDLPLFDFRKAEMRERLARRYAGFFGDAESGEGAQLRAWLLAELADNGPLRASDIEHDANRRSGPWWGWSAVKRTLEYLFRTGEVAAAPRVGFERRYALPEHVLPRHVLDTRVSTPDAHRELVARAAVALGVATADDLADYFRLPVTATMVAIRDLEEAGELVPVEVEGWMRGDRPVPAWRHRDAPLPRRIDRTVLLSPFDPVVWYRKRALRLYDFHYRIEIYTPAHKRRFGYYSLPVLIGDRVSARVDLKNDRKRGVLRVQSAWREEHAPAEVAEPIAAAIRDAAAWQVLGNIEVAAWGDLAPDLAGALGTRLVPRELPAAT